MGLGANLGESESQEEEHDSEERERHWGSAFDRDDCPGKAKLQILRAGRATEGERKEVETSQPYFGRSTKSKKSKLTSSLLPVKIGSTL